MLTKIFLSLISVSAVAQAQVTTTPTPIQMTGSSGANSRLGAANTSSTTQLNQVKNPTTAASNMNGGAKSSNAAQLIGMATNLGISGFMATKCAGGTPETKAWSCPMAALSAAQAAQMLAGSGGSKKTAAASGGFGSGFDWGSGLDSNGNPIGSGSGLNLGNDGTNTTGQIVSKATKDLSGIKNLLASNGYTYDPNTNTVTTPDGNKVPASAFSSPQAMSDSGMFSPGQMSEFNEAMSGAAVAAADRARVIEAEMDEGGGGGSAAVAGSAGRGSGRGGSGDGGPDWSKLFGKKDGQDKASKVAPKLGQGLDTRIGREGNIWEAITRTYNNEVAAGRTGMGAAVAPAQQALNPGRKPSSLGNQ